MEAGDSGACVMLLLTGATGSIGSRLLPLLLESGRGRALPGPRAAAAGRAAGRRADRARRPRRDVRPLPGAPGAARRRHGGPPGGDDPRPAAAPDRGAERAGDGAAAAGGGAQRRAALRLLQRPQRLRRPAHPLLPRQGAGRAGGRVLAAADDGLRPSIVYDHSDPWITLLRRFSFLPVLPVSGSGQARYQPIWAATSPAASSPPSADGGGALRARRARRRSATTRCPIWSAAPPGARGRSSTSRCRWSARA